MKVSLTTPKPYFIAGTYVNHMRPGEFLYLSTGFTARAAFTRYIKQ